MIFRQHGCDESKTQERTLNTISALQEKRFISLYIEPASACNLRCRFCDFHSNPNGDVFEKGKGIMGMDLFEHVLAEVESLPFKFKCLPFYLHGEPLLNKNIHKMVSLAKARNVADSYLIDTNGILLDKYNFTNLVEAGIDSITVSLDTVSKDKYRSFKGEDRLPLVLGNIMQAIDMINSNNLKVNFQIKATLAQGIYGITDEDCNGVIEHFRRYAENSSNIHVVITKEISWYVRSKTGKAPACHALCEMPFYQVAINYDGVVCCCCADITYSLKVGCLGPSGGSLQDILSSERLNWIRRQHLSGKLDSLLACKFCGDRPVTNLRDYKEEVLQLI